MHDTITPEIAAVIGIASSLFAAGVSHGIMKNTVARLEKDLEGEKSSREVFEERFVTMKHFEAVVAPIQLQLKELGRDIKQVLLIVSKHKGGGNECDIG